MSIKKKTAPVGRIVVILILLSITLVVMFVADISTGSSAVTFPMILDMIFRNGNDDLLPILVNFRIPRALTAILAGAALSVSGLQMQTVFRNPLAGPYVLGISSGASLGVAILTLGLSGNIVLHATGFAGSWTIALAAWAGSAIVLLVIMIVSGRVRDIMTVLILGIMLASAISAIVSIMQYFSSETMLKAFVIWTMGSLGNLSWVQLNVLIISVSSGLILCMISIKRLDALLLGEEYASSLGLNVRSSRYFIFLSTSILAGSVTAFCGPIAFIGIAVPHITRLAFGSSTHRMLVPGSILVGSVIMLAGDIVSQLPGSDRVLPINSVTALIGIPVMVWIIMRKNRLISVG